MTLQQLSPTDIQGFADFLSLTFSPEDLADAQKRYIVTGWPKQYKNNETGKTYKPHHELERQVVFSDGPRALAILGGEGCVAAETVINGVPIADRLTPSQVTTLAGSSSATAAYLKGHAPLYCVEAQLGLSLIHI